MRDRELYATILGVQAPWTVERVELDVAGGAVHVWLTRTEGGTGAVSRMPDRVPDLRSSGAAVAASRHVPAPDPTPRAGAPRGVPDPRRGAERGPVGDSGLEVHPAVRAAGDRLAAGSGRDRGRPPAEAGVGRRVGHRAPGGRARPGAPRDARAALPTPRRRSCSIASTAPSTSTR